MGPSKDKRYFDREFKYEAIRLMNEGKGSVRDIAKDLDVHPNVLHRNPAMACLSKKLLLLI